MLSYYLRVARTSHWLLEFNIEHELNSWQFLVTFSEISIVLIIVKVIEESNPLNMAALSETKEQIGDNTDTSHLNDLSTSNCFDYNYKLVWRFWIERDFDLALCLPFLV